MGGGRMKTTLDEGLGQTIGSHMRVSGRLFGLELYVDEIVTEREPPTRKVWETVGSPRLLVIGSYRMGFETTTEGSESRLRVFIDYALPTSWLERLLGRLCGRRYAKWCTQSIVSDAVRHFATAPEHAPVQPALQAKRRAVKVQGTQNNEQVNPHCIWHEHHRFGLI
jgi:hypothetical protein